MAISVAETGFGTTLIRDPLGAGVGPDTIIEVTSLSGATITRDTMDLTHMLSPDGYKEFAGALADGGEVTIEGHFLPGDATQQLIISDMTGANVTWRIAWPDTGSTTWTFSAFPTNYSPTVPHDGKMTFSATLKVSGAITIGP